MTTKKKRIVLVVACALVDAQGQILLSRRPEGKFMAGFWEFPGGKIEEGETPEEAVSRELYEELDIVVQTGDLIPTVFVSHAYDDFHLLMPLYLCKKFSGVPKEKEGQDLQWVKSTDLVNYRFLPADLPFLPAICSALGHY